jgi:hypothetical protein
MRLGLPLSPSLGSGRATLIARCGVGAIDRWDVSSRRREPLTAMPDLVMVGDRPTTIDTSASSITVKLSRDVAASATACGVQVSKGGHRQFIGAWMTLRRGKSPACRRASEETVALKSPTALVFKRPGERTQEGSSDYYRACLRPAGRSVGIAEEWAGGGGGGGGSENVSGFVSGKRWLAWVQHYQPSNPDRDAVTTLWLADLGATGSAGAPIDVLDRSGPGGSLTDVAISADGRSITWLAGEATRSAVLP